MRSLTPRRILPVAAALTTAVLLAGCSAPATTPSPAPSSAAASSAAPSAAAPSASAAPSSACATSGSVSQSVKATGAFGTEPKVTVPTGVTVPATQRSVLKAGSGPKIGQGDSVRVALAVYDMKTGKKATSTGYGGKNPQVLTVDAAQYLPALVQSINCGQAKSRVAVTAPAADAFGATGNKQLGIGAGDPVLFIVDIDAVLATSKDKATGAPKKLPAAFPTVTLASSGQPTIRIPSSKAPTTLKIAESKSGSGDTVKSGDNVTAQYQGVIWRTGGVFDQSWGRAPANFTTDGVVKGFAAALVGHRVGSQVVAIIPPAQGYGTTGNAQAGIKATDDLVFVIDILATTHAG